MTGIRTGRKSMKQTISTRNLLFKTKLSRRNDTLTRYMYYLTRSSITECIVTITTRKLALD